MLLTGTRVQQAKYAYGMCLIEQDEQERRTLFPFLHMQGMGKMV